MSAQKGQYYFTLKGAVARAIKEYKYYTKRPWSLEDVGKFWDTVTDYDDINSSLYPYYRRFSNSHKLTKKYLDRDDYKLLDIQTRSGNGTLYWYRKNKINNLLVLIFLTT